MKIINSQSAAITHILVAFKKNVQQAALKCLLSNGFIGVASSETAPGSFEELQAFYKNAKRFTGLALFPVYSGGNDNSIYDCVATNKLARAWHDLGHILLNAPFTLEGEKIVAEWQCAQLHGIDKEIMYCDVVAQVEYYINKGEFVANQKQFVTSRVFA